jgi:hypothetical protein
LELPGYEALVQVAEGTKDGKNDMSMNHDGEFPKRSSERIGKVGGIEGGERWMWDACRGRDRGRGRGRGRVSKKDAFSKSQMDADMDVLRRFSS